MYVAYANISGYGIQQFNFYYNNNNNNNVFYSKMQKINIANRYKLIYQYRISNKF